MTKRLGRTSRRIDARASTLSVVRRVAAEVEATAIADFSFFFGLRFERGRDRERDRGRGREGDRERDREGDRERASTVKSIVTFLVVLTRLGGGEPEVLETI